MLLKRKCSDRHIHTQIPEMCTRKRNSRVVPRTWTSVVQWGGERIPDVFILLLPRSSNMQISSRLEVPSNKLYESGTHYHHQMGVSGISRTYSMMVMCTRLVQLVARSLESTIEYEKSRRVSYSFRRKTSTKNMNISR